jgi:site-specific recombinase XerD
MYVNNYSIRTITSYTITIERICSYCRKEPHQLNEFDFKAFFEHLVNETNLCWNSIHAIHGGLSFFFRVFLNNREYKKYVKYPKRPKKLPVVMSYNEVRLILQHVKNFKHNTVLKLLYSTGMRLGEVQQLTLDCVDFERKTIRIVQSKGRKDRYVAISPVMGEQLIEYIERYNPTKYLFETDSPNKHYSASIFRHILTKVRNELQLKKRIHTHCFRHTFATHMIEQGCNILVLQRILGHEHLEATLVYLHTQNVDILRAPNPLDNLGTSFMLGC